MITEYLVSFGAWNWLIAAAAFLHRSSCWRRAPSCSGSASSALLVGIISPLRHLAWRISACRLRGVRPGSIPLWRHFARGMKSPAISRSSSRADAVVGRESRWKNRSWQAAAPSRSTDTIWRLSGPDSPAGSRVKVVRADAATLVLEKM